MANTVPERDEPLRPRSTRGQLDGSSWSERDCLSRYDEFDPSMLGSWWTEPRQGG